MNVNIIEKASILIREAQEAFMGVIDENGFPSVSTLSSIKTEGIFKCFYATGAGANKTKRILADPRVSVCYRKDDDNVTLVGEAGILTDQETRHNLWQDWFINHFPKGMDDPDYVIIQVIVKRVSLWIQGESAEFPVSGLLKVQSRCGLLCDGCAFREQTNCGKCLDTNGHPFHGECPVAVCCQDKGHMHCGECEQFPCHQLHTYSCLDKEHGDCPPGARLSVLQYWKDLI